MSNPTRPFEDFSPTICDGVYIDPSAAVIGNVHLAEHVSVWPMAVIRGDVNRIEIGSSTNIQDAAILHVTHDGPYTPGGEPLIIGNGVTIGHKAVLHACFIGNFCLIGIGAIILDKVVVGDHVLIAAGSLVPPGKELRSGYLYMGNPIQEVRALTQKEKDNLEYSSAHYVRLKNKYLQP
ncbi:gamma carbonic anhydrase family protein [Legionella impletisoli]|uniref:Gamma carbonic anhydrase family protein n=1 Tax=Legionella impletisoli TaxID=343510 RepID=A0A917JYV1_9GAMM|nr:gamma carbonic anhydrase family protein [Legionella impletisoli]GGI90469.1 gamma carbonic anhydrase family protein [Legionella impletisoli]